MSAGDTNADVTINLRANDQASGTIDQATANINAKFKEMNNVTRAGTRQFETNNWQVYQLGRTMQATGRIVDRSISLFNSYNLMQIRIQQSVENARMAHQRASEALAVYGINSLEYQRAAFDAKRADEAQAQAAEQAKIQFGLMVGSMVAQSGTLIATVLPRMAALRAAMLLTSGTAAVGAASPVAGIAGGAAAGGIVGRLGTAALRGGLKATPAIAAVSVASMLGEQQAGETRVPTGAGAIREIIFNITGFDIKSVFNQVAQTLGFQNSGSGAP